MKLNTIEDVQKRVGSLPAPRDLKVIDHMDGHALRWLSHASFAFMAFGQKGQIQLTGAGGDTGFASPIDSTQLQIPLAALDDDGLVSIDSSFGSLFLISGMDETLRINGKVSAVEDGVATLQVEECYLHCAKAFRRSHFWQAQGIAESPDDPSAFIRQTQFLVIASMNRLGQVDVSPKGDPAQFLLQKINKESEDGICFADRPGNRRIDGFRNIVEQAQISILALIPGGESTLEIQGSASLHDDPALLQAFTVQNKKPKLCTWIKPSSMQINRSQALHRAALWPPKTPPADIVPADIFKDHMRHSKENSVQAKLARAAVSLPGAMKKGLEIDYKKNLY